MRQHIWGSHKWEYPQISIVENPTKMEPHFWKPPFRINGWYKPRLSGWFPIALLSVHGEYIYIYVCMYVCMYIYIYKHSHHFFSSAVQTMLFQIKQFSNGVNRMSVNIGGPNNLSSRQTGTKVTPPCFPAPRQTGEHWASSTLGHINEKDR